MTHCKDIWSAVWIDQSHSYPGIFGSEIPVRFQLSSHHCIRQTFKSHARFWAGMWFQSRNPNYRIAIIPGVPRPHTSVSLTDECGFVFIATLLSWGRQHIVLHLWPRVLCFIQNLKCCLSSLFYSRIHRVYHSSWSSSTPLCCFWLIGASLSFVFC